MDLDRSVIGADTEAADQSYLFKMSKHSRKILAEKDKKEKKGQISSVRRSRKESICDEPPVKQALANKKTDIILVQKFYSEWDQVLKENQL